VLWLRFLPSGIKGPFLQSLWFFLSCYRRVNEAMNKMLVCRSTLLRNMCCMTCQILYDYPKQVSITSEILSEEFNIWDFLCRYSISQIRHRDTLTSCDNQWCNSSSSQYKIQTLNHSPFCYMFALFCQNQFIRYISLMKTFLFGISSMRFTQRKHACIWTGNGFS
jgi:hypothetical protein